MKIADARKAQLMTQGELAEKARLTPAALSRIERGHVTPRFKTIRAIAAALDVDVKVLTAAD